MPTLHKTQSTVFKSLMLDTEIRNGVVVAARGWGKSYFASLCARTAIEELRRLPHEIPNKNVYIIAPTFDQVRDIYWPLMAYVCGMEAISTRVIRDEGTFECANGAILKLMSYEAIERLRGKGAYFIVMDEVASWHRGQGLRYAWESIIEPAIITRWSPRNASAYAAQYNRQVRAGRSLTISTPHGYDYLHEMYTKCESDKTWKSWNFDYTCSPYLDVDEIERVKADIDPVKFAREYLASFKDSGSNVFYCFDRSKHVVEVDPLKDKEDVHVAIDFNVGVMAASTWVVRGKQVFCIDEFKGHPDTQTLADVLKGKYRGHKILCYPDPSGKARKTSAVLGVTDFTILRNNGLIVLAKSSHPAIVDSVACVNRMLNNANNSINMYVSHKCKGVITSLERTQWVDNNPNLAVLDKSEGIEHFSDGIRYFIDYAFPISGNYKASERGFAF